MDYTNTLLIMLPYRTLRPVFSNSVRLAYQSQLKNDNMVITVFNYFILGLHL